MTKTTKTTHIHLLCIQLMNIGEKLTANYMILSTLQRYKGKNEERKCTARKQIPRQ